jgi:copper transport protein
VLVGAAYAQLAGRVARADTATSFGEALAPARIWHFLAQPAKAGSWVSSGTLILVQNVLFAVAAVLLVALFVPRVPDRLDSVATAAASLAVTASLVSSLPTNLGTETFDDVLGAVMTQTHIIAGCTWLGGLGSLALLSRSRRALGAHSGLSWARLWQRFSILALTAVGAVIISGSWLTWKHVGGVAEFATTTYGRFLLVKLLVVLAMVAAGAYNQFLLTPRIARAHAAGEIGKGFALTLRHFPAVVAGGTALGICVLVIVPFLTGSARAQAGDGAAPTVDGNTLAREGADARALTMWRMRATFPIDARECAGARVSVVHAPDLAPPLLGDSRRSTCRPEAFHAHARTVAVSDGGASRGCPPVTKSAPNVPPGVVGVHGLACTNSGGSRPGRI